MTKTRDPLETENDKAHRKAYGAYESGRYKTALRLYGLLAERGDVYAQTFLTGMYRKGQGCSIDLSRSAHWLDQAIKQANDGSVEAQWALHVYFRWGAVEEGIIPLDSEAANHWLIVAASSGHAEAQYDLAENYRFGANEFEKDLEKSEYWVDKAMAQQYPDAFVLKSFFYLENGLPTEKALELLNTGEKLGSVEASEWLDYYRKVMSPGAEHD